MNRLPDSPSIASDEVEIHAPDINVDEIMATIRGNIQRRQDEGLYQTTNFPEFDEVTCPEEPTDEAHSPLLYFLLREMNNPAYDLQFKIEPDLTPSSLDKLPGVRSLWRSFRYHLHSPAVFYLRKMTRRLIEHNRYMKIILNLMTRENQKRDLELAEMKQRLTELESHLARLEQKG